MFICSNLMTVPYQIMLSVKKKKFLSNIYLTQTNTFKNNVFKKMFWCPLCRRTRRVTHEETVHPSPWGGTEEGMFSPHTKPLISHPLITSWRLYSTCTSALPTLCLCAQRVLMPEGNQGRCSLLAWWQTEIGKKQRQKNDVIVHQRMKTRKSFKHI